VDILGRLFLPPELNVEALEDGLAKITHDVLFEVAQNFYDNLHDSIGVLILPLILVGRQQSDQYFLGMQLGHRVATLEAKKWEINFDALFKSNEDTPELKERFNQLLKDPEYYKEIAGSSKKQLDRAIKEHGGIESYYQRALILSISSAWTALETLASDMWVTIVNASTSTLGK
jgi:hypothetical protein